MKVLEVIGSILLIFIISVFVVSVYLMRIKMNGGHIPTNAELINSYKSQKQIYKNIRDNKTNKKEIKQDKNLTPQNIKKIKRIS